MGQTLLSVLAIALLSLLALSALQSRNADMTDRAQRVVAEEARGLSAGLLDQLAALPFDGSKPRRTLAPAFGPPAGIDPDLTLPQVIATSLHDLDDAHGLRRRALVTVEHLPSGLTNPLVFQTDVTVAYVRQAPGGWEPSADTTNQKRVTLRVSFPQTETTVELTRVYSDLKL